MGSNWKYSRKIRYNKIIKMTTEKQPKDNTVIYTTIYIIGLLIMFIITFYQCDKKPQNPITHESTLQIQNANLNNKAKYWQNEANKWRAKRQPIIDSTKKSVENHYHYYTTVEPTLRDTCQIAIQHYKRIRDITDSLLMWQINWQDSALIAQDSVIKLKNRQIKNDTLILAKANKATTDTIKHFNKAMRKRYWKGFRHGFGIGVIVTEVGNVVKDIKR